MEHEKKLAFVANMTDKALQHVATTPNIATPRGMSHDKMLSFVAKMAKDGLQHFDSGGNVLPGPMASGQFGGGSTDSGLSGGLGNAFGTDNKFKASGAPIQQGTTNQQLESSYNQAQGALNAQNSINNLTTGGANTGASAQNRLSDIYQNQINGGGPNPALAQLNEQTGKNISAQAALAAGQRGAGANAGLIATQAAQQGAATQQQAVGQAATLQAQQQLAAEQNLQNLSANQIAQGTSTTQALNNAQQNEQNILQGSNTAFNNALVGQQSNINNVNAQVAAGNQSNSNNLLNGIFSGGGSLASIFAKGGMVKKPVKMAEGGVIQGQATSAPVSYVGQWLSSNPDTQGPGMMPSVTAEPTFQPLGGTTDSSGKKQNTGLGGSIDKASKSFSKLSSSTEDEEDLSDVGSFYDDGGQAGDGGDDSGGSALSSVAKLAPLLLALLKDGGKVKALDGSEKAVAKGDSLKNDKVPAVLSEGEIVIPRSITMSPNAPMLAAQFVARTLAKGKKK